jgi:hypothetical protein
VRLEEEIAQYVVELTSGPARISAKQVQTRLLKMLKFPRDDDDQNEDRALNDPLGLWGRTPGWRCWVGRHGECEPLGADESCSCSCGIGGHGTDQSGVTTPGCGCGHEGMGERWHAPDCAWRSTWRETIRQAARDMTDFSPTEPSPQEVKEILRKRRERRGGAG